jgi:serine/threonine-protein kinase
MGVVYRALHQHLGRRVAIKLLAPELAQNDSFRERFVRESRLAAAIDHPNVIPIYEAAELDGTYFIAMRYVDGVDLKQVIRSSGRLTVERAVEVLTQVAGALDAAHARDLVHRDVKPGNVLVANGTGHCYLTDFGLTKAMSSSTGFTATGQFVGTTDYCAPEQIEGKPLDRRTDVYALGCVFFECLTGAPPFPRDSDMATMWAHIQEPPPAVTHYRPELPEGLDWVLTTALAKKKDDRYPTASAFAGAAVAALETFSGQSYSPGYVPPVQPAATDPAAAVPPPVVSSSYTRPEPLPGPPPPPAPSWPPAAPAGGWTPGPYDSQPTQVQRQKPLTAIALIVAALLLAGGGTAAALIISKDKKSPRATSAAAAAAPVTTSDTMPTPDNSTPTDTGGTQTQPPVGSDTTPTDTAPATPPPDTSADAAAASAAAEGHWQAIAAGEYGVAFDYFTSSHTGRQAWINSHQNDRISKVKSHWKTDSVDGDSAVVEPTKLRTVSGSKGCQTWSGTYTMAKEGGEWKIAQADLNPSPCG